MPKLHRKTLISLAPYLAHEVNITFLGIAGIGVVPIMLLMVVRVTSLIGRLRRRKEMLQEIFSHILICLCLR